jgi:putative ABC transport system permease protein
MRWLNEALRSAALAIRTNFLRSVLTTLGIIIGVASVILMVAIGDGARSDIEKRISSLGTNLLQVRPGSSRVSGRSTGADSRPPFSERDIGDIRSSGPDVVAVSGHLRRSATAIHRDANWLTSIDGVHAAYLELRDWQTTEGRFFTDGEYQSAARLAVLGATAARQLFGDLSPIGVRIRIGEIPFDVIGVLEPKGADPGGRDQDDVILAPLSTVRSRLVKRHKLVPDQVGNISVKVSDESAISEVRGHVEALLRRNRGVAVNDNESFHVRDLTEYLRARTATQQTLSLLLAATAAISLVVGGIGIMNIMLVSVTERTREIGLRMAVGARRRDIRVQFLSEAVMLCLIGGLVGCAIGIGGAVVIASTAQWPVLIAPNVVLLAMAAAAFTGICFGFLPAQRAAHLNPIEALRSE